MKKEKPTMIYKQVEIIKKEIEIVEARCLFCNKSVMDNSWTGLLYVTFGYGSENDGDVYESGICDKCFNKHLKKNMVLATDDVGYTGAKDKLSYKKQER